MAPPDVQSPASPAAKIGSLLCWNTVIAWESLSNSEADGDVSG
jgi:hypothetical protein